MKTKMVAPQRGTGKRVDAVNVLKSLIRFILNIANVFDVKNPMVQTLVRQKLRPCTAKIWKHNKKKVKNGETLLSLAQHVF